MVATSSRLSNADLRGALSFLADADDAASEELFPAPLLARMSLLFPDSWITYNQLEPASETVVHSTEDEPDAEAEAVYWSLRDQIPVCTYPGPERTIKLSDFVRGRRLHRQAIYTDYLRPWGMEDILDARLPAPVGREHFVLLARLAEFDARDLELLELLRPHLARLQEDAIRRRRAAAGLAAVEAALGPVVVVGEDGGIELITPGARDLIAQSALALEEGNWISQTLTRELAAGDEIVIGGRPPITARLATVNGGSHRYLVLEDGNRHTGGKYLTAREREVLGLVARGMTNGEIGGRLFLSPGTVRKHLENAYAKLGVNTRTGAVAKVFLDGRR